MIGRPATESSRDAYACALFGLLVGLWLCCPPKATLRSSGQRRLRSPPCRWPSSSPRPSYSPTSRAPTRTRSSSAMRIGPAKAKPLQAAASEPLPRLQRAQPRHYRGRDEAPLQQKLHMYVAQARFIVAKPQGSINLAASGVPARCRAARSGHQTTGGDVGRRRRGQKKPSRSITRTPAPLVRGPADGGLPALDLQARGRLPVGIALANKIREGGRQISDLLEFEGELTLAVAVGSGGAGADQAH